MRTNKMLSVNTNEHAKQENLIDVFGNTIRAGMVVAVLTWFTNIYACNVSRLAFILNEPYGNNWVGLHFHSPMVSLQISENIEGFHCRLLGWLRCASGGWTSGVRYKLSLLHFARVLRLGRDHGHK